MSVIDTLITDRSAEDVAELMALLEAGDLPSGNHKGAYNASDLNRVGSAVAYLRTRLAGIGIHATGENLRTNWTAADIPTQSEMDVYLSVVAKMREDILEYRPEENSLPESMRNLDYKAANEIESLLKTVEDVVRKIILSYRGYSGRLTSGVNALP